jgi:hypothetical protein
VKFQFFEGEIVRVYVGTWSNLKACAANRLTIALHRLPGPDRSDGDLMAGGNRIRGSHTHAIDLEACSHRQ